MTTKKQIILIALVCFTAFSFFSPLVLLAQNYVPLAPLPNIAGEEGAGTFPHFVENSFYLLIGIAGVLAVIMIMLGGIQYMTTDAIGGKEEGKERITKALLGLFLAIGAWLILSTINPNLLSTNLSLEEIEAPPEQEDLTPKYYLRKLTRYKKKEETMRCLTKEEPITDMLVEIPKFKTLSECKDFIKKDYGHYPLFPHYDTGCDRIVCEGIK